MVAFGLAVLSIVVFVIIKYKKAKDDLEDDNYSYENDEYEENDEDIEFEEEKIDLDEDEELFRRVNKSKFRPLEDTKKLVNSSDNSDKTVLKDEEEKSDVFDNYFKNIDNKRKGKHF